MKDDGKSRKRASMSTPEDDLNEQRGTKFGDGKRTEDFSSSASKIGSGIDVGEGRTSTNSPVLSSSQSQMCSPVVRVRLSTVKTRNSTRKIASVLSSEDVLFSDDDDVEDNEGDEEDVEEEEGKEEEDTSLIIKINWKAKTSSAEVAKSPPFPDHSQPTTPRAVDREDDEEEDDQKEKKTKTMKQTSPGSPSSATKTSVNKPATIRRRRSTLAPPHTQLPGSPSSYRPLALLRSASSASYAINPISDYEEPISIPGLTLYDIHRVPRKCIQDENHMVTVRLRGSNRGGTVTNASKDSVDSIFRCPICLCYMRKASIVMVCLHRFCSACIEKCIRVGKRECPSCRVHIPSRRSLRRDDAFDSLMRKIYGNDLDKVEKHEEEAVAAVNKLRYMNNAYALARERALDMQMKMAARADGRHGKRKRKSNASNNVQVSASEKQKRKSNAVGDDNDNDVDDNSNYYNADEESDQELRRLRQKKRLLRQQQQQHFMEQQVHPSASDSLCNDDKDGCKIDPLPSNRQSSPIKVQNTSIAEDSAAAAATSATTTVPTVTSEKQLCDTIAPSSVPGPVPPPTGLPLHVPPCRYVPKIHSPPDIISFVLRKHPQEKMVRRLHREYFRTAAFVSLATLKRFLGQKLSYVPWCDFQILVHVLCASGEAGGKVVPSPINGVDVSTGQRGSVAIAGAVSNSGDSRGDKREVVLDDDQMTLGEIVQALCNEKRRREWTVTLNYRIVPL